MGPDKEGNVLILDSVAAIVGYVSSSITDLRLVTWPVIFLESSAPAFWVLFLTQGMKGSIGILLASCSFHRSPVKVA